MASPKVWVVHTPVAIAEKVEASSVVAVGWSGMGNLSRFDTREKMKDAYHAAYPDDSEPKIWVVAGQLYRFAHVIQIGDYVLTPTKSRPPEEAGQQGCYRCRGVYSPKGRRALV